MVVGGLVLVILLALLLGAFCFYKRRRVQRTSITASENSKPTVPMPNVNTEVAPAPTEPIRDAMKANDRLTPTTPPQPPLDPKKSKNQRGGYSKQQFDEFG